MLWKAGITKRRLSMNRVENGLKLKKIKSSVKTNIEINELEDIENYIRYDSFAVVYLDNEVLIGKYKRGFSFYEDKVIEKRFIKRMRIFNCNEEFLLWRSNGILKGRFRTDDEGDDIDCVEANQIIFGTDVEYKNDHTILTEQRGTKIIIPGIWKANNNKLRVAIQTRHYIGYKYDYQASYIDARFVEFVQLPKGGE